MIVNLNSNGKKADLRNVNFITEGQNKGKPLAELIADTLRKYGSRRKNISFLLTIEETRAVKKLLKPLIGDSECEVAYRHLKALLPSYPGLEISCGYTTSGEKTEKCFEQPLIIEYTEAA